MKLLTRTMTVISFLVVAVAMIFGGYRMHLTSLNNERNNAQREKAALEQSIQTLTMQNEALTNQMNEIQETITSLQQKNQELQETLSSAQEELDKVQKAAETFSKMTSLNTPSDWKAVEEGTDAPWTSVKATAYNAFCPEGCNGVTATGYNVKNQHIDHRVIAVDPKVIPLYSVVEIKGLGYFKAMDTGGAIKGKHVDILVNSEQKADRFGTKNLEMRVVRAGPY